MPGAALSACVAALALSLASAAPAWTTLRIDLLPHHDISLALYPEEGRLRAIDTLTLPPGDPPRSELSLSPSVQVTSVSAGERSIPFTHRGGVLSLEIGARPGATVRTLRIAYEGRFRNPSPEAAANADDPTFGVAAAVLPEGTFLGEEADWYPRTADPFSTFHLRVEAPDGYEAVTAGTRTVRETLDGRTVSEWDVRTPVRGLSMSAARYVVRDRIVDNVLLSTYLFPRDDHLSGKYLDAVERYIGFYRKLLGPYPFAKFAVVENFFPTGYGFPSWTLLGGTVIRLPFILESSLGHEVAHSWWGNGVFVAPEGGNWSEGLTTYVADYLYKERSSAAEGREYRLKILRDYSTLVTPENDFPLERFAGKSGPATQAVGYGKAAMVFHMARMRIGDDAFWKGLQNVVRTRMFRSASWNDFAVELGAAAGADLSAFFRQWVDRPGAPSLRLSDLKAERSGTRWRISGQLKQRPPYYALRVPLRLESSAKAVDLSVSTDGASAPFTIDTERHPDTLRLDPDVDLFRRLDPLEIPPSVNRVRGAEDLAVVVARGFPSKTLEAARPLLAAMGRDNTPLLREEEVTPGSLAGRNTLFLGVPSGKGFLPPIPFAKIAIRRDRFAFDGKVYAAPGDALFAVFSRRAPGKVAAVFVPLSPSAATAAGRKIPHYGQYGYLVFSNGVNTLKGSWEPAESPSIHRFPVAK